MDNTDSQKRREQIIYKTTFKGSIVNLVLISLKFPAGIWGNSAAMVADAVHSLSDFVTDVIVIVFVRISNKPKDKNHTYGHGKFETLATLIIGVALLFVGVGIAWSGSTSIYSVIQGEEIKTPSIIALIAAIVTILSKEGLYRYTIAKEKKIVSPVLVANA